MIRISAVEPVAVFSKPRASGDDPNQITALENLRT